MSKLSELQKQGWTVMNEYKGSQVIDGQNVCVLKHYATKDNHKTKVYAKDIDELHNKLNK
jgi:hypothetical protein